MAAGAAAVVCRQRLRGADLRDRLVPDAGAVRRLLIGVDRRAARNVHGRDVSRQLSAAALHLAASSSAEGLRAARDRDRRHRAAAAAGSSAGRTCLHRVGRLRRDGIPAARPCRQHLSAAADARDGRHAARRCALGTDDARPACRGSGSSTLATSPAPSWAHCSPASTCCACTT